jgi:predicted RNase H-like HicB family nuclease
MKYAMIIETGAGNYSSYVPDLPGCIATGRTLEDVKSVMREALAFHIEGLREDGLPVPPPTSLCEYVKLQEGAA